MIHDIVSSLSPFFPRTPCTIASATTIAIALRCSLWSLPTPTTVPHLLTMSTFLLPNIATSPLPMSKIYYWQGCWIRDKGRQHCQALELCAGSSMTSCASTASSSAAWPSTTEGWRKALQDGLRDDGKSSLGDGGNNCDCVVVSVQGVDEAMAVNGSTMEKSDGKWEKNWWRDRIL